MTFAMRGKLDSNDFRTFINKVRHNDYSDAADELKKTSWCTEVGEEHCLRDAYQLDNFCNDTAPEFL